MPILKQKNSECDQQGCRVLENELHPAEQWLILCDVSFPVLKKKETAEMWQHKATEG